MLGQNGAHESESEGHQHDRQSFADQSTVQTESLQSTSGVIHGYGGHTALPRIVTTSTSPPIEQVAPSSPSLSARGYFSKHRSTSPDTVRQGSSSKSLNSTDRSLQSLHETRKLLLHLVERIESRPSAPDLFSKYGISSQDSTRQGDKSRFDALKDSVADLRIGSDHEVSKDDSLWDTEPLVDLLGQLLGLLSLAKKQSLDLFKARDLDLWEPPSPDYAASSPTPKRRARLASVSPRVSPRQTQNFRPGSLQGSLLLRRLIDSLKSLVAKDCLYQVRHARPALPPNSLQAMCLELASYLLVAVEESQEQTVEVLNAVVTGFYSFPTSMTERLLAWFEGTVGTPLSGLRVLRSGMSPKDQWTDPFASLTASASIPILALPVDSGHSSPAVEQPGWKQWASPISGSNNFSNLPQHLGIVSAHAAGLESSQYYLASVFASLIQAVTSTVQWSFAPLTTIHRVHRLFAQIIKNKPDASLDLLEVVAYGTADASYSALAMLATFWPKAMGHVVIAKPLPVTTYEVDLYRWDIGRELVSGRANSGHEYVPWRCDGDSCGHCGKPIHDFALTCVLCQDVLHLNCYSPPDQTIALPPVLGQATAAPSAIKFSHVLRPSKAISDNADKQMQLPTRRVAGQHQLILVNLFTLAICAGCDLPLWGMTAQAYVCEAGCHQLFHHTCVDVILSTPCQQVKVRVTIHYQTFRQSYEDHFSDVRLIVKDIANKTADELAILHALLWTQLELLENGLTHSSLVIQSKLGDRIGADDLDLPQSLGQCLQALRSSRKISTALEDYQNACPFEGLHERYMHDRPFLSFITALMRSPVSHSQGRHIGDPGLLHVGESLPPDLEESTPTYETLELGVMRGVLRDDFGVLDKHLATVLLGHLHSFGFFQQDTLEATLISDVDDATLCMFPLPSVLDATPGVETLLSAIEVSLGRLDLAVNEHALVLLIKRAWPSGLCSNSTLQRLAAAVIRWILGESTQLLIGIEQYASKHETIPGLRSSKENGAVSTSVADFQTDRRRLTALYAVPWLRALHHIDASMFTSLIYDIVKHVSVESGLNALPLDMAQECLRSFSRLREASVIFSGAHELLIAWLRDLGELASQDISFRYLPRLLQGPHTIDSTTAVFWDYTRELLLTGRDGQSEALRWCRISARSGVYVPSDILRSLRDALCENDQDFSLTSCSELLDYIMAVGLLHAGRPRTETLDLALPIICRSVRLFEIPELNEIGTALLREMLWVILSAYGIEGDNMPVQLRATQQSNSLSSRLRHVTESEPLPVNLDVLNSLAGLLGSADTAPLIAHFLLALLSKGTAVAGRENVIRHLSRSVCSALWAHRKSSRWQDCFLDLLLLFLPVHSQALLQLIMDDGDSCVSWLWRLLLDLAERDTKESSRPWRKAVVDLLFLFLDHIGISQISVESDALRRSILPAHLAFMTTCFEDALIRSGPTERLQLLNRLDQHRSFFIRAPIVGWATLEALSAECTMFVNDNRTKEATRWSDVHSSQMVRAGLVALMLWSMSNAAEISSSYHKRLLAQARFALEDVAKNIEQDALTLLAPSLRSFMDSSIRIAVQGDSAASPQTSLVGKPLVNSCLQLFSELDFATLSFPMQRCLLDCCHAIVFKHTTTEELSHGAEALRKLAKIVQLDISMDVRLQALSILETAVQRYPRDVFYRALPDIVGVLSDVIAMTQSPTSDSVVAQKARSFMRVLQDELNGSGFYLRILKEHSCLGKIPFMSVLRLVYQTDHASTSPSFKTDSAICDMILADVFQGLLKATRKTSDVTVVLRGARSIVVSAQDLSIQSAEGLGDFLSKLERHVSDWSPNEFDPNPVLDICAKFLTSSASPTLEVLSSQSATFLALALAKFDVEPQALNHILRCAGNDSQHPLWLATQGQLLAATRGQAVTDSALLAMLQALVNSAAKSLNDDKIRRLMLEISPGCLGVLLRPTVNGRDFVTLLSASHAAAQVILMSDQHDNGTLPLVTEALGRQAVAVQLRVFSFLSSSALRLEAHAQGRRVSSTTPIYGRAIGLAFKACADFLQSPARLTEGAELLTRAFLVTRSSMLLLHQSPLKSIVSMVWLRVWPDLERLLYISLRDEYKSSPLRATLHSCFLDLIVFMSAFSPQLMLSHGHGLRTISVILETESPTSSKARRALLALEHPIQTSLASAIEDLETDLAATERLLGLRGLE